MAGMSASTEDRSIPGRQLRPGDVCIRNWDNNRDLALDVVISSPLQLKFLFDSSTEERRDAAITAAESRKDRKSLDVCAQNGFDFAPLAFDTFGGCSDTVRDIMSRLITCAADRCGMPRALIATQFRQRISLAIQRINASMLLSRAPDTDIPAMPCC